MAAAQENSAKTVLESAARTLGLENLGSIRYTGSGFHFAIGQAPGPDSPWPKFNLKSFTRVVDFDAAALRDTMVRIQFENPPRGGGLQPIIGEQTQTSVAGPRQDWAQQFDIWITPQGFLKGALAGNASVDTKVVNGTKHNVVSFTAQKKYRVTGYLNEQNLIERVETCVDNPVLGDMPVELAYSSYKDFKGFRFPEKIVEKQGGYPVLDITVTDAARNVIAGIQLPPAPRESDRPRVVVDERLVAEDIYYFTGGTHHSVIVNFNDYVVVIEGPLDEERSKAVISEVRKLYFNKPIRYLVNTHQHFDHAGGIRTYAAAGATILTYQINKPYYEKTFALPRTLNPDDLSKSKKKAVIEAVGEKRVVTDGTHTVELYHIQNSGHNDGMLIAYIPKEKIVIEADLYTPGPPGAPASEQASPYTVSLVDNLDRLKLDYEKILGLHGRESTKAELLKAAHR